MTQTFIGGVGLAILSAITFVAYRHPKEFYKLFIGIIIIIWVYLVSVVSYMIGLNIVKQAVGLSNLIELDAVLKVYSIIDSVAIPIWIAIGLPLVSMAYLSFLASLPFWLTKSQPPEG